MFRDYPCFLTNLMARLLCRNSSGKRGEMFIYLLSHPNPARHRLTEKVSGGLGQASAGRSSTVQQDI